MFQSQNKDTRVVFGTLMNICNGTFCKNRERLKFTHHNESFYSFNSCSVCSTAIFETKDGMFCILRCHCTALLDALLFWFSNYFDLVCFALKFFQVTGEVCYTSNKYWLPNKAAKNILFTQVTLHPSFISQKDTFFIAEVLRNIHSLRQFYYISQ